jgi:translation elongation factor EF-G
VEGNQALNQWRRDDLDDVGPQVYTERMKREYKVETEVGKPRVNFREKITKRVDFDYLHKKQSGGQGQYGRVIGYIEPMTDEELEELNGEKFEFVNGCIGNNIPPGFIPSIEKVRPSIPSVAWFGVCRLAPMQR